MFKNLNHSALGISGHQSEIIELALTFGFKGFDLEIADFATRVKLRGMPYARRLIDSAKIGVGTFELPIAWDTDEDVFKKDLEKLPHCAEVAAEVGCTRCLATVAPAGNKLPYHENFEFHRGRFAAICEALQPAGVRFGIGFRAAEYLRKDTTFQFIHDFDALTLLMNMVAAPNIGLLLDVWDLVACGGSVEAIRQLSVDQIVAVQLADMPAGMHMDSLDEKSRLLPGAENGQIDLAGALRALTEMGYDGPVTVKPSPGVFETRRRDLVVKKAAEALDKVWRMAKGEFVEVAAKVAIEVAVEVAVEAAEPTAPAETTEPAAPAEPTES